MSRQGANNTSLWPGANAINARPPQHHTEEFVHALGDMFGPTITTERPISSVPITAETLQSVSGYLSTAPIVENTWLILETVTGWFFRIAPLSKQAYMNNTIMTTTYERRPWDRVPEGVTPSYWTHKTDFVKFAMQRYEYSLKFEGDFWFYGAEHAKEIYRHSLENMYSNWVITVKMYIEKALINANLPLWEKHHTRTPPFKNIADATRLPRGAYCALSKEEKGLYTCILEAESYALDQQFAYDTLVVPHGTMDRIATNNYHTEASRIGDTRAYTMLTNGGKMLKNINGIDIYENTRWNLDGVAAQDIEGFVHTNMHGGYIYNDGDGALLLGDNVNMRYGFEYINSNSSSWMRKDFITLLKESGRWNNTGSLHEDHVTMADNLPRILEQNKTTIYGGMLDPFMYRVDTNRMSSAVETSQDVGSYAVVRVMGEADIRFSSLTRLSEHIKATMKILETDCCDELRDLRDLCSLSKRLTEVEIDPVLENFIQAINLNEENRVMKADNSFFIRVKGSNSAPLLPHRIADLTTHALFYAKLGAAGKSGLLVMEGGAEMMVLKDANGYGLYPVADAATKINSIVAAPAEPLGYGMINGLRVLASMYKSGLNRGWNMDTLKIAFKGVEALDCLMLKLKDIYTAKNLYFNPAIVPVFMRTGDNEIDMLNGAISALWLDYERPIMARLPVKTGAVIGVRSETTSDASDQLNIGDMVIEVLTSMLIGATALTGVPPPGADDKIVARTGWKKSDINLFGLLFVKPQLGLAKARLFGNKKLMKEKFTEYSRSNYARTFANELMVATPARAVGFEYTFAALVDQYVLPQIRKSKGQADAMEALRIGATVLQGLIDLVIEDELDSTFSVDYINALEKEARKDDPKTVYRKRSAVDLETLDLQTARVTQASKKHDPTVADLPTFGWINMRLSIHSDAWKNLGREAEQLFESGKPKEASDKLFHLSIRPMSTEDPTKPLFGETISTAGMATNDVTKDALAQMSYSQGHDNRKNYFQYGAFFLGGTAGNKQRKKGMAHPSDRHMDEEEDFERHIKELRFDAFSDPKSARLPQALFSMYPSSTSDDRPSIYAAVRDQGDHTQALKFVLAPWVQERMAYLEKFHSTPMERMIGKLFCLSPTHMDVYESMVRHNVPPYCKGIIQARPWKTDLVAAILFAQSGAEVAESGFFAPISSAQYSGPYNFIHLQFSIWIGMVIKQPHKLLFLTNKVMRKNISGMGGKMMGRATGNAGVVKIVKEGMVDGFIILTGDELKRTDIPAPLNILSERDIDAYPHSDNVGNIVGDGEQHVPGLLFCQQSFRLADIGATKFAPKFSLGRVKANPYINRDCWPESCRLWDSNLRSFKMHEGDDYYGAMNPSTAADFLSGKGPLKEIKLVEPI